MTLELWQPVTQISMLRSKKAFRYHVMNPSQTKIKRHYLFTYLIDPYYLKLYFNIYYCYSYCINMTIVS